uniref:Bulb-type lectin domain-containing protein n=1 Tax=Hucho hucho TaxID=62062 RepID=A0A4W5JY83_9TELE
MCVLVCGCPSYISIDMLRIADFNLEWKIKQILTDGNLVLYCWGRVVWSSNTVNKDAQRLILKQDGNLVIYTIQDQPIWASNTCCCSNTQRGHLTLTDKGALELYRGQEVIWRS